jgi:hypothetical protein
MPLAATLNLTRAGFCRTDLRANTIHTIFKSSPVPVCFRDAVIALSAEISQILAPLAAYLESVAAVTEQVAPSFKQFQQDLVDHLVRAAYLSVCIRLERNIFWFYSGQPGDVHYTNDHESVNLAAYQKSKAAAATLLQGLGDQAPFKPGIAKADLLKRRSPLIKILVWPAISIYKKGNGKPGGEEDGMRCYQICKQRVVCFWGLERNSRENEISLKNWIEDRTISPFVKAVQNWKQPKFMVPLAATLGAAAAGASWFM